MKKCVAISVAVLVLGSAGVTMGSSWGYSGQLDPSVLPRNDTTPPETSASFEPPEPDGQNGWYVSCVTVTLTASDNESAVAVTMYRLDNGTWDSYTAPVMVCADGIHTFDFYSVDSAGNIEVTHTLSFKIDQTPPTGWPYYVDETSGVAYVEFYVDGVLQYTDTEEPFLWILQPYPDIDPFEVTTNTYDVAGNINTSSYAVRKVKGLIVKLSEEDRFYTCFALVLRATSEWYFLEPITLYRTHGGFVYRYFAFGHFMFPS